MRTLLLLLPLALAGCASSKSPLDAPTPEFAAERFFAGHTEGQGQLKIAFSEARAFTVHGDGAVEPDGTLVLDQVVEQDGKTPERREWRMKRSGSDYTGTLTDAKGVVNGDVHGNRFHIRFTMTNGMHAEQFIYLQSNGRTALNRMTVRKLGVPVAHIEETIRRTGE